MADIRKFEQAVVYLDGQSLIGQVEEIELPEPTWSTVDHEAVGLRGTQQFAGTMEALETTITTAGYSKELAELASDPYTAVNLQIRQLYGVYRAGTRIADETVVLFLRGRFLMRAFGSISQGEADGREYMMVVDSYKETVSGTVISEFSIDPPIFRKAGGIDVFETVRAALGI